MKAKSKRKGNFPPLRFPEFKAEWKRKKLGEVGTIYNGLSGKTRDDFGRGKKYIQYKQIFEAGQINLNDCGLVNIEDNEKQNQVQYGDIFFTMSSETPQEIGMASVLLTKIENVFLNSFCLGFRLNSFDIITPLFARFLFRSKNVRDIIVKLAQGSTRYNMSKLELLKVLINIPDLNEQTKIASFLFLIDERIQTQMKIIEEWEKLKKGMIDELFSQKMRFINEKKNFICKTKSLSTLLIKNNEKNKKRKYSKVQSVSNKLGFANQEEIFANRRVASINTSNYYVIRKGIFAYNPSRIDVGSLAYKVDDEISIISPLYVSFWTKKTYVVDLYLFYWFSSKYFITQMNSSFEGSVRNTLSYESLGRMKMVLPPIDKQQEIASILSSFDKKLSIERQILAQYQNQKKYLLQNMFI